MTTAAKNAQSDPAPGPLLLSSLFYRLLFFTISCVTILLASLFRLRLEWSAEKEWSEKRKKRKTPSMAMAMAMVMAMERSKARDEQEDETLDNDAGDA